VQAHHIQQLKFPCPITVHIHLSHSGRLHTSPFDALVNHAPWLVDFRQQGHLTSHHVHGLLNLQGKRCVRAHNSGHMLLIYDAPRPPQLDLKGKTRDVQWCRSKVGQKGIYAPYMTEYLVISLPTTPFI
jgi:hypothetical protein